MQTPPSSNAAYPPSPGQSCVVLPGTFKSMLLPNTTGDISITIPGISCLNDLLVAVGGANAATTSSAPGGNGGKSIQAPPTPGADTPSTTPAPAPAPAPAPKDTQGNARSQEFQARIQLTYRQTMMAGADPQGLFNSASNTNGGALLHGGAPSSPLPGSSSSGQVANGGGPVNNASTNMPGPLSPSKRIQIQARGKMSITTTNKGSAGSSSPVSNPATDPASSTPSSSASSTVNVIRQYDMMFVQSDFEPGQQFFSVTFNKTLVQNGSIGSASGSPNIHHPGENTGNHVGDAPATPPSHHSHHDKGLMLSGHYTCLRNYDIGTVRVHLPPGLIVGDLAPQFTNGGNGNGERRKNSNFGLPLDDDEGIFELLQAYPSY